MEKISQECQYIGQKLSLKTELNIIEENVKEVQDEYESLYRTVVSVTGICSGSRH
jgi:ABC-type transport system involved in cytochrome c biogenesis ATPase subunit